MREQWQLRELLSATRMAPYLTATGRVWDDALALYDWNTRVGSAFFESLHYLEVGMRNAFDVTIASHLDADWLSPRSSILSPRARQEIFHAMRRSGGAAAPHGKILAELSFGFWWSLVADQYNRSLWQPALRHSFAEPVRRRRLHAELDELRRLRNRIAHHEPIHARDLSGDYQRLLGVSGRLSASLRSHIVATSRVPTLLQAFDWNESR